MQISRAKMRAETVSRRVPISSRSAAVDGQQALAGSHGLSLHDTLAEIKVSAARPRVRSFREALDQVRACEALGVTV